MVRCLRCQRRTLELIHAAVRYYDLLLFTLLLVRFALIDFSFAMHFSN